MTQQGRPSIFSPKDAKKTYILTLTTKGQALFEAARKRLKKLTQWSGSVSNADVTEYLLRGEQGTRDYLKKKTARDT